MCIEISLFIRVIGYTRQQQQSIKSSLCTERCKRQDEAAADLKAQLPQHLQRAADLASEKGAYTAGCLPSQLQLMALLFIRVCFVTHFACATTGHVPADLPRVCVCGAAFTSEHTHRSHSQPPN